MATGILEDFGQAEADSMVPDDAIAISRKVLTSVRSEERMKASGPQGAHV